MSDLVFRVVDPRPEAPIADAAAAVAEDGALGIVYAPSAARFVAFTGGRWEDSSGAVADFSTVFEAVFFTETRQARWVRRNASAGALAVITESSEAVAEGAVAPFRETRGAETSRLLWGRVSEVSESGWATVSAGRTGEIAVPVGDAVEIGQRVRLTQVTYLTEDEHGNRSVADVRYTGLSVEKG